MSTPPIAARPRPWLRPQFSLGTLFWLMLVVGLAAMWWKDRSRLEQRIVKLEQMVSPTPQPLWGAADILGPPDDPTGAAGKSWCPARSTGTDWVEVAFDTAVAPATIESRPSRHELAALQRTSQLSRALHATPSPHSPPFVQAIEQSFALQSTRPAHAPAPVQRKSHVPASQ